MLRSASNNQHLQLFNYNDRQHNNDTGVYGTADHRRSADHHHNHASGDYDHNAGNHHACIDPDQHDGDNHHGDDNRPANNHAGVNPQHDNHDRANNNDQAPDHDDNSANDLHSAEYARAHN